MNVTCGQDDLINMYYPFGNMDPLEIALIVAHAARSLRIAGYGIYPGADVNLVILEAKSSMDALSRCEELVACMPDLQLGFTLVGKGAKNPS